MLASGMGASRRRCKMSQKNMGGGMSTREGNTQADMLKELSKTPSDRLVDLPRGVCCVCMCGAGVVGAWCVVCMERVGVTQERAGRNMKAGPRIQDHGLQKVKRRKESPTRQ